MANDLTFSMGGDVSAFERAMTTAVTTGAKSFAQIEAACRASSQRIDAQFGTTFSRLLGGAGNLERAFGALKIAGAAFVGFEILKAIIDSIEESAGEASKEIGRMAEIGQKARGAGVGTDFFQGFSEAVKKLGLDASQAEEILKTARGALDLNVGEGDNANSSTALDRVRQNVLAGNLNKSAVEQLQNADGVQDKERVILNLLDELQHKSENLAAFDLAGKVFGPDFEQRLRNGENIIGAMRDAMAGLAGAEASRVVPAGDIATAEREQAEAAEQNARIQALLADYHRLIQEYNQGNLDIVLEIKDVFISTAEEVKNLVLLLERGAAALGNWDLNLGKVAQMLGSGAVHDALAKVGLTVDGERSPFGTLEGAKASFATPRPLDVRGDRSRPLPSLSAAAPASAGKQTDEVENLIKSLDKAAAAEQGEAAAVGLSNKAKQESIDLAKADEAAKERGTALTAEERTKVLAAADAYTVAKGKIDAFNETQKQAAEQARYFGDTFEEALDGLILKGQSLHDVLKNILSSLESSALKALITGQGPLAGLFGTAPKVGATGAATVGGLFGFLPHLFGFADGGRIAGSGGTRSDSILARVSPGEFIVNARSAAGNLDLLHAINDDRLPRFATGGLVNVDRMATALPTSRASSAASIDARRSYVIDARGAQLGVGDQITAAIRQHDGEINRTIGQRYANWRQNS